MYVPRDFINLYYSSLETNDYRHRYPDVPRSIVSPSDFPIFVPFDITLSLLRSNNEGKANEVVQIQAKIRNDLVAAASSPRDSNRCYNVL